MVHTMPGTMAEHMMGEARRMIMADPTPMAAIAVVGAFGNPTIVNNVIRDNYAWRHGGGIGVSYGSPLIMNNLIEGIVCDQCGGGIGV